MRISDWSSDVCSSDLFLRADDVGVRLADRVDEQVTAFRPYVRAVVGRGPADIEAHHLERRGIVCGEGGRGEREQRDPGGERKADHWILPLIRRSEEHTSELQSIMRISYAVFCLKKKQQ